MTPDEAPDTPDTPVTQEHPADTTDWQKRYTDLQPEYTRTTQALKAEQDLWEDPDALAARLREKHPDWFEDDEEPDTDEPEYDTTPAQAETDPRIEWLASKEAERQYNADFKEFVGDREVHAKGKDWIEARSRHIAAQAAKPWGPDHLKAAVDDYFQFVDELTNEHLQKVTDSKKAPRTPPSGQAGAQVPKLDTHEDRRQFYRQRIAEKQSQQ
jgi:hypothetical protein